MDASTATAAPGRAGVAPRTTLLIVCVSIAATVVLVLALPRLGPQLHRHLVELAEFGALAFALQFFAVPVYGGGAVGVTAVGLLACGIAAGAPAAMAAAVAIAFVQWIRSRGQLYKAVYDAAQFALAVGAGAATYHALAALGHGLWMGFAAGLAGGLVLVALNNLLLCLAIGIDEEVHPRVVWRERFRWARWHYLSFGPLAYAAVRGYDAIGFAGLVAFTVPPGLLLLSVRQYVTRTREALEKERAAKEQYRTQSRDMQALFELTAGLAVRSHDREAVVGYAQERLARLLGAESALLAPPEAGGIELATGGKLVASLRFVEGERFDRERWERLRPALLPQIATAIESAELVGRVWRTHLETIGALSRSMEAKDGYTGGHTERAAAMAVAIAKRLGFKGEDLDAIEVGALLHDIGKIGIPERILNKPDALDEDEWKIMKEHPLISDRILGEIDLHPIVRQIARSSHERYDGAGYPDGLAGDRIPLAASIVLVADAIDALTTNRPYRPGRHLLAALQEIREHTGSQFCPRVVATLEELLREQPHLFGISYLHAVDGASA